MHAYTCGRGTVEVDDHGLVIAVRHPDHDGLNAVLDSVAAPWFGPEWRWGTGMLLTSAGTGRFVTPRSVTFEAEGVFLSYGTKHPGLASGKDAGLQLSVTRTFGTTWQERYVLRNPSGAPVTIGSFGINTPISDTYGPAATVLRERMHAHVWTGGATSGITGIRMDGAGPRLRLTLTEGELWAYAISGRNQSTSSNIRGVISLLATDHARSPHAFGGQPVLTLGPGEELVLGWEITWTTSDPDYSTMPASLAAPIGTPLSVGSQTVSATSHGVSHVDVPHPDGRRSRVAVLHHTPLPELVSTRVSALLENHRAVERDGIRAAAFVPYDTQHGLRILDDLGWTDWSDGRERVGMALLLAAARQRGWVTSETDVDAALLAYKEFCLEYLIDSEYRVRDGSTPSASSRRLYNRPWFALLFAELFSLYGDRDDLTTSVAIMDRYYSDGGAKFLAICAAEAVHRVTSLCAEQGLEDDAARLRESLVSHGLSLASLGTDLPAHEVMYEQSMTAPLLSILIGAWQISPSPELEKAMAAVLPWLLAFAGRQPHVRLRNVPIRHWDGFWFGRRRLYGDTFPHYWCILSPRALLDWPESIPLPDGAARSRIEETIHDVPLANLVDFTPDGNASCAFLLPSCVDDEPAHFADPLANDQDMGLALSLLPGISGRTLL